MYNCSSSFVNVDKIRGQSKTMLKRWNRWLVDAMYKSSIFSFVLIIIRFIQKLHLGMSDGQKRSKSCQCSFWMTPNKASNLTMDIKLTALCIKVNWISFFSFWLFFFQLKIHQTIQRANWAKVVTLLVLG